MPMIWSFGTTSGPIIGGILSNPSQRWPNTLGRIPYLQTHPYFLPCAVAGLLAFVTFAISFLGLKEVSNFSTNPPLFLIFSDRRLCLQSSLGRSTKNVAEAHLTQSIALKSLKDHNSYNLKDIPATESTIRRNHLPQLRTTRPTLDIAPSSLVHF
jgi:MFS family permease